MRTIRTDRYPFEGKDALRAHATNLHQPIHREYDGAMLERSRAQAAALIARLSLFVVEV